MPRNIMKTRIASWAGRCLLLAGLPIVVGCSWKAPTPSDYAGVDDPSDAWIIATPNPVPAGRGPGKTIVNWYTGDGSRGEVYVSIGGGAERLFSTNMSHQEAIIDDKHEYEFRLYAGSDHLNRLATTRVTREPPTWGRGRPDRLPRRAPR